MEHEPNANGVQRRQCSPCPTYGKGGTVPRSTRCNEHVDPVWCVVGSHNFPAIAFPISSTDIVHTSHHDCHDTEAIHCSLAGHPCAVFCALMCLTFAYCPSLSQRLGASRQRLGKRLGASRQIHMPLMCLCPCQCCPRNLRRASGHLAPARCHCVITK
jgi:hypothetical protein